MTFPRLKLFLSVSFLFLSLQSYAMHIEQLPDSSDGESVSDIEEQALPLAAEQPRRFINRRQVLDFLKWWGDPTIERQKNIMAGSALAIALGIESNWKYDNKIALLIQAFASGQYSMVTAPELKAPLVALSTAITGATLYPLLTVCAGDPCAWPAFEAQAITWIYSTRHQLIKYGMRKNPLYGALLEAVSVYNLYKIFSQESISEVDRYFVIGFAGVTMAIAVLELSSEYRHGIRAVNH